MTISLRRLVLCLASVMLGLSVFAVAYAGSPSGDDWFQLFTLTQTGADSTGDGGTGNPSDLNYYYVGQTFTARADVGISAITPSNGADLILDYDKNIISASALTPLTAYQYWTGQSVDNGTGQLTLSAYNDAGTYYTGQRSYANVSFTLLRPSAANYGLSPTTLTIDYTPGVTTDSNIARNGLDYMNSKEDFGLNVWADTKAPYAQAPSPTNGATGVAVDSLYSFEVRDSKSGVGNNAGVGTGFGTDTTGRVINAFDGSISQDLLSSASYSYTGVWQSVCTTTVSPPSITSFAGDTRRWAYNKTYQVSVSGFKDRASSNQDQLGDANGPNTMAPAVWTFTTEADVAPPYVLQRSPAAGASGVNISTSIYVDVVDKKTANISGTGVDAATCHINVSSPSFALTHYSSVSVNVTVAPVDYGYRFTIVPATAFAQNEVVSVSVFDCRDLVGNVMVTDNYTFMTADSDPPYVTAVSPINHGTAAADATISFHIKDDGGGVDLANTVVYVDGTYYTDSGGAGSVTTNGTKITYASSLNFNGGNYVGDPTVVGGSASDYSFTLKPQTSFTAGQSVPVIIYSRDSSGNLMERYVFSFAISGVACDGSSFCGTNTSWSGGQCVGTGGGTTVVNQCPQQGGSPANILLTINDPVSVTQIDESSVLVSWLSNQPTTGRVLYGSVSPATRGDPPDYGYANSTPKSLIPTTYHAVVVSGLKTGFLYYFRPVALGNGIEVLGSEVIMAPRYPTVVAQIIEKTVPVNVCTGGASSVPTITPVTPSLVPATPGLPLIITPSGTEVLPPNLSGNVTPSTSTAAVTAPGQPAAPATGIQKIKIQKVDAAGSNLRFNGVAAPNRPLNLYVYSTQPRIFKVVSDANGQWSLDIPNDLEPGVHTLIIQDTVTHEQDLAYFTVAAKPNASVIERVTTFMPPAFLYVFIMWAFIILGLIIDLMRLAYRKQLVTSGINYRPHALLVSVIALLVTLVSGLMFEQQTQYFSQFAQPPIQNAAAAVSISGSVINPLTRQGIGQVDLAADHSSIRTAADGRYAFSDLIVSTGLKITQADLLRSVRWMFPATPRQQTSDILFDPAMFNSLVMLTNTEAEGKWDAAYALLPSSVRLSTNPQNLQKQGTIFVLQNIRDQEIVVEQATFQNMIQLANGVKLPNVVRIKVRANGTTADYLLVYEQAHWAVMHAEAK